MSETSRLLRICCQLNAISRIFLATPTLVNRFLYGNLLHAHAVSTLVLTEQVAGGIVVPGSGRLITCLGVNDLIIVDMPDTLLVTTRARSQEVKRLVKKTRDAGWQQLL